LAGDAPALIARSVPVTPARLSPQLACPTGLIADFSGFFQPPFIY
jgi:hypothetical protein